jgi:acyl-coenzyme A thioesterase PaaI-like protein
MPWEFEDPPPIVIPAEGDLDESEAAAVAATRAAGERAAARGTSVSEEILAFAWGEASEGHALGELRVGPELTNRVGHIQGGALYGAAMMAAARALGPSTPRLVDGHYQFLRPADGASLAAEAVVLRRGRGAAFVQSRLSVDATLVGAGLFAFRL